MMARFFAAGARGARWYPAAFAAYYRIVLTEPAAREQRDRIVAQAGDVARVLHDAWRSFGAGGRRPRARARRARAPCSSRGRRATGEPARPLPRRDRPLPGRAPRDVPRAGHAAFAGSAGRVRGGLEPFLALARPPAAAPGQSATIASPSTRIGMRKSERPHGGPATHSPVSGR
jgi:4,5:9,10-diseco-3-hydroxy-5,9,17-trioxoandrosta-1(10),2-diene-4-oate hydrolase